MASPVSACTRHSRVPQLLWVSDVLPPLALVALAVLAARSESELYEDLALKRLPVPKNELSKKYQGIERSARRKLLLLDAAETDLRIVPGNHLEALRGDREGQHSIRINDQFRICFVWTESGPSEVEIVDYH
jgi:toxin HigB-1